MYLCKITKDYNKFFKKGEITVLPDYKILMLMQKDSVKLIRKIPVYFGSHMPRNAEDCETMITQIQHKIDMLERDKKKANELLLIFKRYRA